MKYWNKDKKTRDKHWHKVVMPVDETSKKLGGEFGIKHILTKVDSPGKFFMQLNDPIEIWWGQEPTVQNITIWFQNEKDAILFKLKYS